MSRSLVPEPLAKLPWVILLLVAAIFVAINLAVDVLYTIVDPRLRLAGRTA